MILEMKSKVLKPIFYLTKYERHLLMPYDEMVKIGVDATLDILLDHGFTTKMELTRVDDDVQNMVEFVQDLVIKEIDEYGKINFKHISDFEPSGEDTYH